MLLASADFNDWWVVADRRHAYPQPFWRARQRSPTRRKLPRKGQIWGWRAVFFFFCRYSIKRTKCPEVLPKLVLELVRLFFPGFLFGFSKWRSCDSFGFFKSLEGLGLGSFQEVARILCFFFRKSRLGSSSPKRRQRGCMGILIKQIRPSCLCFSCWGCIRTVCSKPSRRT